MYCTCVLYCNSYCAHNFEMKYGSNRFSNAWRSMPSQSAITASWNARQIAAANASRLKVLSKQVYRNRGELKVKHNAMESTTHPDAAVATQEFTLISQGDDVHNRTGNHIYIKGYKLCGWISHAKADVYVVLSRNGVTPQYGDFIDKIGGFLYASQRQEFTVLARYSPKNATVAYTAGDGYDVMVNHSKRLNVSTFYNGVATGTGVRNRIYLVVKNNTGGIISYTFNLELYFRDK